MDQRSTLTLKSNLKLMHDLLDVTRLLTCLQQFQVLTREQCQKIGPIKEQKERVNELINSLINNGGNAYIVFIRELKNTSDDPKHKRLYKQLVAVKRNLGQSSAHDALAKEDIQIRLSLSVKDLRPEDSEQSYQQLCALIQEELGKFFHGSVRQMLVMEYGLLVKRLELPLLALICQLQLEAKYAKILADIGKSDFGQKVWSTLCHLPAFAPFKEKWTLTARLVPAEEERLRQLHQLHLEQASIDSDEDTDEDEDDTDSPFDSTLARMATSTSLPQVMSRGRGDLRPIPFSQMEQPQRVVWKLLLSYITGGQQYHYRHVYHAMKKCVTRTDVTLLCSNDGFTLFHEVIRNKRADFMVVFQYFGILTVMYSTPVTEAGGEYANIMPTELAGRMNALKERNEMEKLIKIEKSLERDLMKQACRMGNVQAFKERLQSDKHRVAMVSEGKTCLDWAITSGSVEMVKEVIKAEKKINYQRQEGNDQLTVAVILGHQDMIPILLEYLNVTINAIEVDNKSLMEKAAEFGDFQTFTVLHNAGANIPETTVAVASACGRTEFVRECLQQHSPPINVNFKDRRRKTALHFATERGHPLVIDLLIQKGADMLARDKRHRSVLHSAAENGNVDVMNKVIQHAQNQGVLKALLESPDNYLGSELCFLVRGRDQEMSAWHYVQVDRGVLDIFRIKTRGGAVDVAQYGRVIRSGWGTNPSEDIISEVESQFDMVNISDSAAPDMLPLHVAILKNNPECAQILIQHSADVNQPDCFGLTPLHHACMRGLVQVVAALDEKGANRNLRDNKGRSPVQLADANNHPEVLEYMRSGTLLQATKTFLDTHITPVMERLSPEELQRRSQEGENMKQYIKNILRDLVGDVNMFLYDELHSGPVMEESSSQSQAPSISHHSH